MRNPYSIPPLVLCWLVLCWLGLCLPFPATAQVIEEEELEETELDTAPELQGPRDDSELETLFVAAENVFFNTEDPQVGLESINRVLDAIETRRHTGELSANARSLLVRSLTYRAELYFETEDQAASAADLGRIVDLDPQAELDHDAVSAALLEKFNLIRKERIGHLRITADPPDLDLRIDGRQVTINPEGDTAGSDTGGDTEGGAPVGQLPAGSEDEPAPPPSAVVTLLAGIRLVEASRPGYAPLAQEVEVLAGEETLYEVVLERISAVVRLHSRPRDAEVTVDGIPYGKTTGVAGDNFWTTETLGRYRREEFSDEFLVPDLEAGLRVLEVRKAGFRPFRSELRVRELRDYKMPPIVLEEEQGTLVLRNLPSDAELRIDGRETRLDSRGASSSRLTLKPGEHHVQVTQGKTRMFVTRVRLADRQTIELNVRLRPGLAFLGVLGAKDDDLARALRLSLASSDRWSLLDRTPEARDVLPKAGLTADSARRAARGDASAVDWSRVQTAVDARAPGLIYVAAVVSDDLLASTADVWIWAAAPGPWRPDRLRVNLGQQSEIERLKAYFHRLVPLRRPWLGALVVTTDASPHPVIAHVTPGGPLEATGVRPGDQIVSISQVPVFSGADVEARLRAAETGETVDIGVQTPGGTQNVKVVLGSSPLIYSQPIPDLPDAIAYTELFLMAERARPEEAWVIRLNQALILLRARDYEGSARLLRDLKAPDHPNGVGRATVDYWLALALANAGSTYRDAAIEAFRRAAEVPGARLDHHDGPWLAPRAKARLVALGAGSP